MIEIKASQNSTISNITYSENKISLNGKQYIVPKNSSVSVINNKLFINGKEYDKNIVKMNNSSTIFLQIALVIIISITFLLYVLY